MTRVGMFCPMLDQAARVLAAPSSQATQLGRVRPRTPTRLPHPGAGHRAGLELSCEAFF